MAQLLPIPRLPTPETQADTEQQARMIELMYRLTPKEGFTYPLEGVKLMRVNGSLPRSPVLYEPCIVIVFQGRKIGYLGDASFIYDPHQFPGLAVPRPLESETQASAEEPLLAMSSRLNLGVIAELLLALDETGGFYESNP